MPHTRRSTPSSSRARSHRRSFGKSTRRNTSSSPSFNTLIRAYERRFHKKENQARSAHPSVSARLTAAIRALPQCPQQEVDLNALFPQGPDKRVGEGRSGAYVFRIQTKHGPILLKYYADAYHRHPDQPSSHPYITRNDRPFRELLCLRALSGIPGFPVVGAIYCTRLPVAWLRTCGDNTHTAATNTSNTVGDICGMAIVMAIVRGVSLASLELPADPVKRTHFGRAVCCRVLYLLDHARRVLGSPFSHNDLHPENLLIDTSTTVTTTLRWKDSRHQSHSYTIRGPRVTIIDFDLANVDGEDFQRAIRPRQTSWSTSGLTHLKRAVESHKLLHKKTLLFAHKHLSGSQTLRAMQEAFGIRSIDLRDLCVIMCVFGSRRSKRGDS